MDTPSSEGRDARLCIGDIISISNGYLNALSDFLAGNGPVARTENEEVIMPVIKPAYDAMCKHYANRRYDLIIHDAVNAVHGLHMLGIPA